MARGPPRGDSAKQRPTNDTAPNSGETANSRRAGPVSRRAVLVSGASAVATAIGAGTATGQEASVPQPPRDPQLAGEPFPVPEPVLRDEVPREWSGEIEDVQAVEREPIEDEPVLEDERAREAVEIALDNERFQSILAENRYETVGAVLRAPQSKDELREGRQVDVVVFDYDRNQTFEIGLDYESLQPQRLRRASYQPPPTEGELETARELALEDDRVPSEAEEFESGGILVCPDPEDLSSPGCHHRIVDVRFGRPREELAAYFAIVDLSSLAVLDAGPVGEGGCPCPTGEQQSASRGETSGVPGRGHHG